MHLDTPSSDVHGESPSPSSEEASGEGDSGTTAAHSSVVPENQNEGPNGTIIRALTMLYEVCWIAAWAMLLFAHRYYIYHLYLHKGTWVVPLWIGEATVMGSLGGIIYSIYGLYAEVKIGGTIANRMLWFLIKPINGAVLGGVCGLLAQVVLGVSGSTGLNDHILIAGVGLVAGMYEHFALRFIRRFSEAKLAGKA